MKIQFGKTPRKGLSLLKRGFNYLTGVAGIGSEDIILASYPRSGSTWVRFVLYHLIDLTEGIDRQLDFDTLDEVMVELGGKNLLESWDYQVLPRFIKTHHNYKRLFQRAGGTVGIIRDPRDVMVSFYHFHKDNSGKYQGDFSSFLRNPRWGLKNWFEHYLSWDDHWDFVLKYQSLRSDTAGEISRLFEYLGLEIKHEIMQKAVERSSFSRIHKMETELEDPLDDNSRMARKGTIGQWEDYFQEEDLNYYQHLWRSFDLASYGPENFRPVN
jgi:hypothetical protein